MVAVIKRMLADGGALHQLASCTEEKHLYFRHHCEILLSVWWPFCSRVTITWISLAKWWPDDRRPIDGGRYRRLQAKLCLLITRGAGRARAWAGKPGRDQISEARVSEPRSCDTNGYEDPLYLLTLNRMWHRLSKSCQKSRTAWRWCYEDGERPAIVPFTSNDPPSHSQTLISENKRRTVKKRHNIKHNSNKVRCDMNIITISVKKKNQYNTNTSISQIIVTYWIYNVFSIPPILAVALWVGRY